MLTGVVVVFLLQLMVWTYTWVVHPAWVHSRALWRYSQGSGTWSDVTRLQGKRPYIPMWKGPGTSNPWTAQYVQREVRGRGPNQRPLDLLVADGVAVARLRHDTIRGRTNRHGFVCTCNEVRASSHRYFRHHLETANCTIHLCSQDPCTAPEVAQVHIKASSVIPQDKEIDLQDLAGRGSWGRCAVLTSFCGALWCGCCRKSLTRCGKIWCWCLSCRRRPRRVPRPGGGSEDGPNDRHDDSETESEAEVGPADQPCQADQIAIDSHGKITSLATEPCRDIARGQPVCLLSADRASSCLDGLPSFADGTSGFHACEYHRSMYQGSLVDRACAVQGCINSATKRREGVPLCRLHSAKEEKPLGDKNVSQVTARTKQPKAGNGPEMASGPPGAASSSATASPASPSLRAEPSDLAELLVELLQGRDPESAFCSLASSREKWQEPEFRQDLNRMAKDYIARQEERGAEPSKALRALKRFVEPSPGPDDDPVITLLEAKGNEEEERPSSRDRESQRPIGELLGPQVTMKQALFRPKESGGPSFPGPASGPGQGSTASRLVPSPGAVDFFPGTASTLPGLPGQGLGAFRPYHAGAYTDPGPPVLDEASKALQTIAKAISSKDEPSGQERGKLSSIGRTEERLVFLARGCDTLTVHLGEATVGKDLYHALRSMASQNRPLLREIGYPVNISNRIAFGVASFNIGGKGSLPDYCLSVADFPQTSEEEFDLYSPPGDNKLEKRGRNPTTLTGWYRNALRQAWALACVFGAEFYASWEGAAAQLLKLGEEYIHAWPLPAVLSTWEELWGRFVEELRAIDRKVRREMQDESPSFDRLRFFATSPGADGTPWLRLPQTFDLQALGEYFQTDIVPRQKRLLDRACWNMAFKRPSLAGGRAGESAEDLAKNFGEGAKTGGQNAPKPSSPPKEVTQLLGSPLTSKEVSRSMDHRPKDRAGKYLCWDHFSHRKCAKGKDCPHSHSGGVPKWDTLDWSIQMQLLRRGGHPARAKLKAGQVDAAIEVIRKEQAAKLTANVQEGKRAKEASKRTAGPSEDSPESHTQYRTDTRAGWIPAPKGLDNFAPTDMEAPLAALMAGETETSWTADHAVPAVRTAKLVALETLPQADEKQKRMQAIDDRLPLPEVPPHLGVYLRNRALTDTVEQPQAADIQRYLDEAVQEGSAELAAEAAEFLQTYPDLRVGSISQKGELSLLSADSRLGAATGTFTWLDTTYHVYDYGDQLSPAHSGLLPGDEPHPPQEPRQCFFLHVAGGWKEALRAIRRHWVQEHGDHLAGLHSDFFEGLVHPAVLERARHVAVWGVTAEADLEETQRVQSAPHPSLKEHIEEAAKQLWEDAAKGRSLLCYDKGKGLEGVISVPMARVPKMNPDRSISEKGRIIWDATPINKYCHKTRHPPALQPRHQEVARAILWWRLRFPRIRILLSKKDVAEAFKWIPVKLEDAKLFAADVPAEFTQTQEGTTLIYSFLTFGWCGAPGEYMHFAWVIKSAHGSFAPDNHRWEDEVPFHSFVLMDDTVLIEPDLGFRPQLSVALSEYVTKATLGEGSINAAKDALEGKLECRKLIWGLVYDTQSYTRSLPAAKLEKAYHLLHLPDFDSGCDRVPLRLLQELRGNQQFWLAVLPGLSPYLGATKDLLGPADEKGFARARGTVEQQKAVWARFWESVELQRLLVDSPSKWEVRFTHPLTSALTVRELLSFTGMSQKVVWASGDATPHKLAAVDWGANVAVVESTEFVWKRLRRFCAEHDPELVTEEGTTQPAPGARTEPGEGLMISLAELLAVVSLACLRWRSWGERIVIYAGDNSNVISWLAKRHAGPPAARFLLQLLAALETVGGFRLHAEYIRTYHNQVADALTREEEGPVLAAWNLERIAFSEALLSTLDRGWTRRALLWDGMDHEDRASALQLGLRRHPESPLGHKFPLRPSLVCCELGPEPRVYHLELLSKGLQMQEPSLLANGEAVCVFYCVGRDEVATAASLAQQAHDLRPKAIWADSISSLGLKGAQAKLRENGWRTRVTLVSGRTLQDQCWWKRWVLLAVPEGAPLPELPCLTAEDEPATAPLHTYPTEWLLEDQKVPGDLWVGGRLKLDTSIPHLGQATPKPRGTVYVEGNTRRHVWDPYKPLPQLHHNSGNPQSKDSLLLLGKGPEGPAARHITPGEVFKLLGGRVELLPQNVLAESLPLMSILATPRSLALTAGKWASSFEDPGLLDPVETDQAPTESRSVNSFHSKVQTELEPLAEDVARFEPGRHPTERKVGICALPWESAAREALMSWLQERGWGDNKVGGKRKKRKKGGQRMEWPEELSKAMARCLRHEAGDQGCPITEDGWVAMPDLLGYLRRRLHWAEKYFDEQVIRDAVEENFKQRFVIRESDGRTYVAAWSGHTLDGVYGPGAKMAPENVPPVLVHGTYRRHVKSIQENGLRGDKRMAHLVDPDQASGKWRADLEVQIPVTTKVAIQHGVSFYVTGNSVWLASGTIPPAALGKVSDWDTDEFWYAAKGPKRNLKGASASNQVEPVPKPHEGPNPSDQGERGRRRKEWEEEGEPRNSAKLNLAAYRSIAWPPSKAKEKDPREELARTASDLAAVVSGLSCQEDEEEVNVDPDTMKADLVVISEPDWGASDPEIQEALASTVKSERSPEVKTEARFEPGGTSQEGGPMAPEVKWEKTSAFKTEARFEPGDASQRDAHTPTEGHSQARPIGSGETAATNPPPEPSAVRAKGELDANTATPESPKGSDACIPSRMSDKPSGPKWEPTRCKGEAADDIATGSSGAGVSSAPVRDRPLVPKGGLRLGSGKLKLLQEIARADEANWQSLQGALTKVEEDGSTKQELIDDLSRLTAQRKAAAEGVQQSLETEIQRLKDADDKDKGYLEALDAQGSYMREIERMNLVRPSKAVKVLKSARLDLEIEAGVGVWVARRREKGRQRAKEHRERTKGEGAKSSQDPLDSPEEAAAARREAARKEIQDFRTSLLQADGQLRKFRRAPDTQRRKEVKKMRRQTRRNDDASRDTNHAIAHAYPSQGEIVVRRSALWLTGQGEGRRLPTGAFEVAAAAASLFLVLMVGTCLVRRCRRGTHPSAQQLESSRGPVSGPGTHNEVPSPLRDLASSSTSTNAPNGTLPSGHRGSFPSPAAQAPSGTTGPMYGRRIRLEAGTADQGGIPRWHRLECSRPGPGRWVEPCKDCAGQPGYVQPAGAAYATLSGERWHQVGCGHIRGRRQVRYERCLCHQSEASPPANRRNPGQDIRRRKADDADRDTNHAIAHLLGEGAGLFLMASIYLLGVLHSWWRDRKERESSKQRDARRVGGSSTRKVRFSPYLESLEDDIPAKKAPTVKQRMGDKACRSPVEVKNLLGRKSPQLGLPLKSRHGYQQEAINVALDRLALTTRRTYEAQLKWWRLFCARRQVHWLLTGVPADEDLIIDYLLHCAINEQRAPGTLKLRLAAIRSVHVTLGLPDPLEGRNRVAMALAGLRRRYKTPVRRAPVTPRMLQWLERHLRGPDSGPEGLILWAAVCLGFFFLLRASEFLPLGYVPSSRQLKGRQVLLFSGGEQCDLRSLGKADEVRLQLTGSKTNYNLETHRNHYKTGEAVCPVVAVKQLFQKYPNRYLGGVEADEPLFRTPEGWDIPREAVQMLLRRAAEACGVTGNLGSHSLRFGGASALWAAYKDASVVRRYGRWASDAFHTYLWEDREYSRGMSESMIKASLTPT